MQVNIKHLIDEVQCYQTVRELRWPNGIVCPSCESKYIIRRGFDDTEPARQRYECHDCTKRFDDLTDTIFARHHQPLRLLLDSRVADLLRLSNPILVILSSLKSLFFNGLKKALHFSDNVGA